MKKVVFIILLAAGLNSQAKDVSCEAFCGFYKYRLYGTIPYMDSAGQYVAGSGIRADAFNQMKKQCQSINSNYSLYSDASFKSLATPFSSCVED